MWNRICEMMDWNRAGLLTGAALLSGGLFVGCDVDVHDSNPPAQTDRHTDIEVKTPRVHVDTDREVDGDREVNVKINR